jgi:hypothetical protein
MKSNKPKVIKDYHKLSDEMKEQLKLFYPMGYSEYLIAYSSADGRKITALPFETDEKIYMIRMTIEKAEELIDKDPDYNEEGNLKKSLMERYADEYSDLDYLFDNSPYDYDGDY